MFTKNNLFKMLPVLGILLLVIGFFCKLFYPEVSMFVTPDFGQSDLFQLNYPAKYSLHQALQQNSLPLWNKYIGTGFPQLAEGQIGTFNLINLFLYKFFPFVVALNLGYISIYLVSALGTFAYLRFLKFSNFPAFMGAILFAFSGFFVTHMSHINLIQASSYLPWLFLLTHAYIRHKKPIFLLLLLLVLAQQFFSGFPQITFISLCGLVLLYIFNVDEQWKNPRTYILPLIALILFLSLIAVQLLPSKEFLDISSRKDGFLLSAATEYSFPWKHFIGFVKPDFFGTPQQGTYPVFTKFDGSIYWENTGYIGLIPLFLAFLALLKKKKTKEHKFYILLLLVAALMMTGKHSPLYLIYSFTPFNFFRVPSRYILLFVWALTILATYGLEYFSTLIKKYTSTQIAIGIRILVVSLAITQLLFYGYTYNPIGKTSEWLKEPRLTTHLSDTQRYYTIGSGLLWNNTFLKEGWKDTAPFLEMQNYTKPNINIIFSKPSFQVYPILTTNRYSVMESVLEQNIPMNGDTKSFTISNTGEKAMRINGIDTIISALKSSSFKEIDNVSVGKEKIYVYAIPKALPRAYVVYDYAHVETVEEFSSQLLDENFDPAKKVFLEKKLPNFTIPAEQQPKSAVKILSNDNQFIKLHVESSEDGILVLSDLFYPGWQASLNGVQVEVLAANIAQRAIVLPKGVHTVEFMYKSAVFKTGATISVFAHLLIIALIFAGFYYSKNRKLPSTL
ncbi:hypothetical protein KBD09_01650 [Candidatus Woesebacteria bacterium]|nr:hypothetical protein [Candidatus Woesebacteria bacterium]